jgi:hypothetical protein
MEEIRIFDFEKWGGLQNTLNISEISPNSLENGLYEILIEGRSVYILISNIERVDDSEFLLFCLNAATSGRADKRPPFFSGEGLSKSLNQTLIAVSDDSTHFEGVDLGWYLGNEQCLEFSSLVADVIAALATLFSKEIVMFGGSGGGFASLMLSNLIPLKSKVIAMNPQLDILKYFYAKTYTALAFPNQTTNSIPFEENYANWIEFFKEQKIHPQFSFESLNSKCEYIVLQAWNDSHHLDVHIPLLFPSFGTFSLADFNHSDANLSLLIGPWGDGHSVVDRNHLELVLKGVLEGKSIDNVMERLKLEFQPNGSQKLKTNYSFPPTHDFGKGRKLNLVKVDLQFFLNKNPSLKEQIFSWDFFHENLIPNRASLDDFAMLAFVKCWVNFEKSTDEEKSIIWEVTHTKSRIKVLKHLAREFNNRPALQRDLEFFKRTLKTHHEVISAFLGEENSPLLDEMKLF